MTYSALVIHYIDLTASLFQIAISLLIFGLLTRAWHTGKYSKYPQYGKRATQACFS